MFETAEAVLRRLYSEGRPMWTVRENESRGRVVGAWPSGSILRHFCHTEAEVEIIAARQVYKIEAAELFRPMRFLAIK